MKLHPSQRMLAVMSGLDSKRSTETLSAQHGDEPARRNLGGEAEMLVPDLPRRVGVPVVPRADDASITAPCAREPSMVWTRRLRRLSDWLLAMAANDGMSERFAVERHRDEELVRRVARQRRL
jgi:hypothetical protein